MKINKTEKNLIGKPKKKIITEDKAKKQGVSQSYQQPKNKAEDRYAQDKLNSERISSNTNEHLNSDSSENKRKPSDLIIKKGKVHNQVSNHNSKNGSPNKYSKGNDEPQSSWNVSFNKNKRDLFQERYESNSSYKSKNKAKLKKDQKKESDDYANYLKHSELDQDDNKQNYVIMSSKNKSRNDKLREGSSKRHKTPTHLDNDHKDMRIILAHDPNFRHQDRQNSRNDFVVYTSNTGGPSIQRDELSKDLINNVKVKDYIQISKGSKQAISVGNKKTLEKLVAEDSSHRPNELNEFNFYTPNNQHNFVKNSSTNAMYMINKHPLSGSAGYSRGLENDSISFRKKSKSRIDDPTNPGYSSRLKSCNYNRRPNVNKSSSFRNLKYSHRSNSNSRKNYLNNNEKSNTKRNQKTKSALSTYMAYKQGMTNKKKVTKKKPIKKKITNPPSMNFFNNKKNSVDSVSNSISGPYLSPFFSSRDGRPFTILKHPDGVANLNLDQNSAISLIQNNNNMVTVDSMKANKKVKQVIPLKDRLGQKQSKKKQSDRNARNDSNNSGNRVSDAFVKERSSFSKGNNLQTNNSFGPEAYFSSDLVQQNKIGGQFFTEGVPSVNESHLKDYYQSRNSKVGQNKSYNKVYSTNPQKSPVKITKRQGSQKPQHPSYS